MKLIILFLLLSFLNSGCGLRERELELEKKINEVSQKEQELLLKEKSLQVREEELTKKEKQLDSTMNNPADSVFALHTQLTGKWNVTMRCTETTCSGSAVGDTKNEQWEFSFQNNVLVARAFSDNKLVRVYSGTNNGNSVELSTQPDNADPLLSTKMIVRIQEIKENEMQGQREILRPDDCHIVYALDFKKL